MSPAPVVVLGATSGPRSDAFRAALARLGAPEAKFIGYDQFLARPGEFAGPLGPETVLRIDSPDRERASLAALYRAGQSRAEEAGYPVLSGSALDDVLDNRGPLGSPAQLALGLAQTLASAATIARGQGARVLAAPDEIALTFDKSACSAHLSARGLPVAAQLGPVAGFDELMERMRQTRMSRVFIKLRHGSSAAGMTALARGPGGQIVATTTAIIGDRGHISATRTVRRLTGHTELRGLIDALAPLGLHVERWLPKIGIDGRICDLRIIVVAGKPVFKIARLSAHPMTNLHLGGERRCASLVRRRVGETVWRELMDCCRRVARAFPACFMLGIDAAILAGDRRHAVLEVNAFGDHVNGVAYRGFTPQEWQIANWGQRR